MNKNVGTFWHIWSDISRQNFIVLINKIFVTSENFKQKPDEGNYKSDFGKWFTDYISCRLQANLVNKKRLI